MSALLIGLTLATPVVAQDTKAEPGADPGVWEVCNETSFILRTAVGTEGADGLSVRGWDRLRPGECESYSSLPDAARYVLAESSPAYVGGIREWKGDAELCAADTDFTANAVQDCALQNLGSRPFLRVSADDRRTILVEPDDYGVKAQTAGLQRLLRDAGYKVSKIDGLPGRRTNRLMRTFLKDAELKSSLSTEDKIDALETAAAERRDALGLTLCNNSSERVWGAVAFRTDELWRSRGWWPVESKTCGQILAQSLDGLEAHLFALQEDTSVEEVDPDDPDPASPPEAKPDRRLRAVATTPSQFCISEARFAAIGRDDCRDRGYAPANFRPLPDDTEGTKVTLTDADFVEDPSGGLRR